MFPKQAANSLVTETLQYFVFFCRSVYYAIFAKCLIINVLRLIRTILFFIAFLNITYAARHTPELIQTIYSSLKLDRPTLMTAQPEELVRRLDSDDNGGILRLEIAVKTLIEESYLYPDEEQAMLQKAKTILEYIQTHDNTFSLERVNMLDELERRIL